MDLYLTTQCKEENSVIVNHDEHIMNLHPHYILKKYNMTKIIVYNTILTFEKYRNLV